MCQWEPEDLAEYEDSNRKIEERNEASKRHHLSPKVIVLCVMCCVLYVVCCVLCVVCCVLCVVCCVLYS